LTFKLTKNFIPKKPRKPKSPRKKLVADLDEITSLYVRLRDKKCVQCGSKDKPTNGHLFPGRYHSLRWDIRSDGNCHQQCWPDNYRHVNHQSFYYDWYIDKFGYDRFKELKKEYYTQRVFSDKELRELLATLKSKYENLKRKNGYTSN
jgi:Bacteriophage Lambda NinG protein